MTTRTSPPQPDELADLLAQATFVTTAVLTRTAADHDLSLTQLRLLGILHDRRVRMSALAAYLGLDKSTLTGLVDRAAERGLLTRAANDTDGRAVDVLLTPAGRELADRLRTRNSESLSALTDNLSPVEQRRLRALLVQLLRIGADG